WLPSCFCSALTRRWELDERDGASALWRFDRGPQVKLRIAKLRCPWSCRAGRGSRLARCDQNWNQSAALGERPQCLADDGADGALGIGRFHGVPGSWRRREQISRGDRRVAGVDLAVHRSDQGDRGAAADLIVENEGGRQISGSGDYAGEAR